MHFSPQNPNLMKSGRRGNPRQSGKTAIFQIIGDFRIKYTKNHFLQFNYLSILMYYSFLKKEIIFPDQIEALGGAKAQMASSMGRSEAPTALRECHSSKPQGNPAAVSYIIDNQEKIFSHITEAFRSRPTKTVVRFQFCR